MNKFAIADDKIAIIGLGYVGLPLSVLLARNYNVIGFDTDNEKVAKIKSGKTPINEPGMDDLLKDNTLISNIKFTCSVDELKAAKIKIITVGTPYDPSTDYIDYSQLESALDILKDQMNNGDVIILKSTVPPGTTNNIVSNKIRSFGFSVPEQIGIAFSPERMIEGQALKDFTSLPKIIGASDVETSSLVAEIIGSLGGPVLQVSSIETAEMVKMVDNYSRFVFLGLTNEIALVSEKIGVDVLELISAAKYEYPRNAGLMVPGPGVGGSCLNKDPFILKAHLSKLDLNLKMVEAATAINRSIPSHITQIIQTFSNGRRKVLIAGVAFKGDTNDVRFTPTFEIKNQLMSAGFDVILSDPYVFSPFENVEENLYDASEGQEILLLLTDHTEYKELNLQKIKIKMAADPIIIDTRGLIPREDALKLGFQYHGYGRL